MRLPYSIRMETLVANLSSKTRRETVNGVSFIVAPVTLIVPGILNGNQGPILYTEEENAKTVDLWDNIPLIHNHPFDSMGNALTASEHPEVIIKTGLGMLKSAKSNGKLTAEAWFDVLKVKSVEPAILNNLLLEEPLEISTGLGMTKTLIEGQLTATDYEPDHLAVFTNQRGACSISDGCGILNSQSSRRIHLIPAVPKISTTINGGPGSGPSGSGGSGGGGGGGGGASSKKNKVPAQATVKASGATLTAKNSVDHSKAESIHLMAAGVVRKSDPKMSSAHKATAAQHRKVVDYIRGGSKGPKPNRPTFKNVSTTTD